MIECRFRRSLLIRFAALLVLTAMSAAASALDHSEVLPDPLEAGWQGESVCEKLHDDAKLRLLRCSFAPNVGHERHFHAPHVGYVIAGGRMRITDAIGTRTVDVPSGSVFSSPSGIEWHEVLNVGETTSIFLIYEYK
jgi:quercetin dioxygenase-like cupin family protein